MEFRYRLQSGVQLNLTENGVVAIAPRPLRAVRLNATAGKLLEACPEWSAPDQLAVKLGLDRAKVAKILPELAARNLLEQQPLPMDEAEQLPTVSVVVPVRNRPAEISECVRSLRALDYPVEKLEIIVVDDASTDDTPAVIRQLPVDRAICLSEWAGPAGCRNAGGRAVSGEIIAYTDSDCEVTPGWLRELVPYFAEARTAIIGGRVDSFSLDTAIERYESVASSLYMGAEERECKPNTAVPFLPTANLLIRREVWQELGGFDPAFPIGEDVDLVWRAHEAGYKVQYVPRGAVLHKYRSRLGKYFKRKAFYGGSETFLLRKHPAQRKLFYVPRQRLPFIALILLGLIWPWLLPLSLVMPAMEISLRYRQLAKFGGKLKLGGVVKAVGNNYATMLLHLTGNVARYYGLPLLVIGLFWTPLLFLTSTCFVYPALYDYFTRRPRLNLPAFVLLYWLELVAHQAGMLGRCLECRTIRPLLPALKI